MVRKIILTAIALVSILTLNTQAATTPENVIKETIVKHSIEMDVDPALALSIAKKEKLVFLILHLMFLPYLTS